LRHGLREGRYQGVEGHLLQGSGSPGKCHNHFDEVISGIWHWKMTLTDLVEMTLVDLAWKKMTLTDLALCCCNNHEISVRENGNSRGWLGGIEGGTGGRWRMKVGRKEIGVIGNDVGGYSVERWRRRMSDFLISFSRFRRISRK
jgi:hypothetical protein